MTRRLRKEALKAARGWADRMEELKGLVGRGHTFSGPAEVGHAQSEVPHGARGPGVADSDAGWVDLGCGMRWMAGLTDLLVVWEALTTAVRFKIKCNTLELDFGSNGFDSGVCCGLFAVIRCVRFCLERLSPLNSNLVGRSHRRLPALQRAKEHVGRSDPHCVRPGINSKREFEFCSCAGLCLPAEMKHNPFNP